MAVDKLRICFIGAGSMGGAIMDGLLRAGHAPHLVSATTASEASATLLRARGISALSLEVAPDANQLLAGDADLIVLGTKPAKIIEVLTQLRSEVHPRAAIVSVAAGITIQTMLDALQGHKNVIRTMPNTPALVGRGVTGLASASEAEATAVAPAVQLFELVGSVIEIPESQIDWLSAVSGSGPAYVFYFIEQFESVAIQHGFSPEHARQMVRETFAGAMQLLDNSDSEPSELRRRVTSPGGTTERAIAAFDSADLRSIFDSALSAAVARAAEIAKSAK